MMHTLWKTTCIAMLLLVAWLPSALSSTYPVSEIPDPLKENAHAVVRHSYRKVEQLDVDRFRVKESMAITLLNKKAAGFGQIVFPYDKLTEKLLSYEAQVYDAAGRMVRKVKTKEWTFSDYSGDGINSSASQSVDVRQSRYPYTVVYQYEKEISVSWTMRAWYPMPGENIAVQEAIMEWIAPNASTFSYQATNLDLEPIQSQNAGYARTWKWHLKDQVAFEREIYAPPARELLPCVRFAPTRIRMGGLTGELNDWAGFGDFYYRLNQDRGVLPAALKAKVHEITDGLGSELEKIQALYRYMQDNTRYVSVQLGIGGWQSFDPTYVYEEGFGDCKALTNYMQSMLKEIGITGYPALVSAGERPTSINPAFVVNSFNHVILCVPMPQDTLWLECTSSYSPVDFLGDFTEDRFVLLCAPDGGKLIRTPTALPEQHQYHTRGDLYLQPDGHGNFQVQETLTGNFQSRMGPLMDQADEDRKKWIKNHLDLPGYDLNKYEIVKQEGDWPSYQVKIDLLAKNCAKPSGSRLFFTPNQLSRRSRVPKSITDRQQAIQLHDAYEIIDTLSIHLPPGYSIEAIKEDKVSHESIFGRYESQVKRVGPTQLQYT
ncbi:MAG: DUF3857 domain-containing protein, partial [Bacteroidota bacterium]